MGTTNLDSLALGGTLNVTGAATVGSLIGNVTGNLTSFPVNARTATAAPGGTTGVIADGGGALQVVLVTSDDANKVITLPAPVVGTAVILLNGGTGYELRSSAPATVAINGGTGANTESAIAASTAVVVICTTATTWVGFSVAYSTLEAAA